MVQPYRKVVLISRTVSALLFSVLLNTTVHAATIPDFTAHYSITIGDNSPAGNRILTFSENNGQYMLTAKTEASGFYSLLSPDPVLEESKGRIIGQQVRPSHYQRSNNNNPKRNLDLSLNWQSKEALSKTAPADIRYAISNQAQDYLSETLSLMLDPPGKTARKLDLLSRKHTKPYTLEKIGDETITTPAGTFKTIKYKRSRPDKNDSYVFIWCAPKVHNLPVKIQSFTKNKSDTAALNSIKGL